MKKNKVIKIIYTLLLVIGFIYILYDLGYLNIDKSYSLQEKTVVEGNVRVSFIDVGQADSILIQTNKSNILIDAGNNADEYLLVQYLNNLDIEDFSLVVATHPHEDHIGGMDKIINNFKIDKFYMPDVMTTTRTFEDLLNSLENNNLKYDVPKIDETFTIDDIVFKVVFVSKEEDDLNNSSIVLKMIHGNNTFLFTGDATSITEKKILDKDIKADVLKVGHHGSNYGTTEDFLNKVNPKYAIISVGIDNSYNHPGNNTISKLEDHHINIYRTDLLGTIIVESTGNIITINNIKTDTNGG